MIDLYAYKTNNAKDNLILNYAGPMSHEIIVGMAETIRQKVSADEDGSSQTALKVFAVFVEQAENIIHYSTEKSADDSNLSFGIVTIGKNNGSFYVSCGNQIPVAKVEIIEKALNKISEMDKQEIKAYYRERRRAEKEGDSKGAGIGFIEMAKKSSLPMEFQFQEIDSSDSFFSLQVTL